MYPTLKLDPQKQTEFKEDNSEVSCVSNPHDFVFFYYIVNLVNFFDTINKNVIHALQLLSFFWP